MPADPRICINREGPGRPGRNDDRRRERRTPLSPPPPLQLVAIEPDEADLPSSQPSRLDDGGAEGTPTLCRDGQLEPIAIVHAADLALNSLGLLVSGSAPDVAAGMIIGLRWGRHDQVSWWTVVNVTSIRGATSPRLLPLPDFGRAAVSTEGHSLLDRPETRLMRRLGCRRRNTAPECHRNPDVDPLEHNVVLMMKGAPERHDGPLRRLGSRLARSQRHSGPRDGILIPQVA